MSHDGATQLGVQPLVHTPQHGSSCDSFCASSLRNDFGRETQNDVDPGTRATRFSTVAKPICVLDLLCD